MPTRGNQTRLHRLGRGSRSECIAAGARGGPLPCTTADGVMRIRDARLSVSRASRPSSDPTATATPPRSSGHSGRRLSSPLRATVRGARTRRAVTCFRRCSMLVARGGAAARAADVLCARGAVEDELAAASAWTLRSDSERSTRSSTRSRLNEAQRDAVHPRVGGSSGIPRTREIAERSGGGSDWHWPRRSSPSRRCCSSMSRRTIWTCSRSSGWSDHLEMNKGTSAHREPRAAGAPSPQPRVPPGRIRRRRPRPRGEDRRRRVPSLPQIPLSLSLSLSLCFSLSLSAAGPAFRGAVGSDRSRRSRCRRRAPAAPSQHFAAQSRSARGTIRCCSLRRTRRRARAFQRRRSTRLGPTSRARFARWSRSRGIGWQSTARRAAGRPRPPGRACSSARRPQSGRCAPSRAGF